jgi:hypothetical protein
VPVADRYKLDVRAGDFVERFGEEVKRIFNDFDTASADFADYRKAIACEPENFRAQVKALIDSAAA